MTQKAHTPRREFLTETARIVAASTLAGAAVPQVNAAEEGTQPALRKPPLIPSAATKGRGVTFKIKAQNRRYDLHRPNGCSVLVIEVDQWPGNEFGLWLPEDVESGGGTVWFNRAGNAKEIVQNWQQSGNTWTWSKSLPGFSITSTLEADPASRCLWYTHTFQNQSTEELSDLTTDSCFHLCNAPQFISIRGERLWACLDDKWTTTDRVPRQESPDPRRVVFLRKGMRKERTVVPFTDFPHAIMPEAACHPLFVAERFDGRACVAIAARNFTKIVNNNDPILRCLHSIASPIAKLPPGQSAKQEAVILFCDGGHEKALEDFDKLTGLRWASKG